jgi:hypothetical protein
MLSVRQACNPRLAPALSATQAVAAAEGKHPTVAVRAKLEAAKTIWPSSAEEAAVVEKKQSQRARPRLLISSGRDPDHLTLGCTGNSPTQVKLDW